MQARNGQFAMIANRELSGLFVRALNRSSVLVLVSIIVLLIMSRGAGAG